MAKDSPIVVPVFWFNRLFNSDETPAKVRENFTVTEEDDLLVIHSKANGADHHFGRLLLCDVNSFPFQRSAQPTTFSLVHCHGQMSSPARYNNPWYSMSHASFDGVTYQIFCGFNCLPDDLLSDSESKADDKVTSLVYDGSPDAQSAVITGPATVYRCYFYEHAGAASANWTATR
jgi:hypothetical protein